jgi:membrane fusion protein (multidrug efflux system)
MAPPGAVRTMSASLQTPRAVPGHPPLERSGRPRPRAFAALLLAALIAACGGKEPGAAKPQGPGAGAPQALPVAVLEARPQRVPVTLEAVGRAEGSREVEVRARVTGILEKQLFREGEPVRAGAALYRIDRAPFEIALAQARAVLEQERARLDRAQLEAGRLRQLVDDRAISQREYDDATAALRQTRASVLAAQARVREAELNLSYTEVKAPIGGIAGRTLRSEGSLVTANAESSLLTTLVRTDPLWVRFSLSEPEYARLRGAGRPGEVRLVLADGTAVAQAGRLNFAGSTVDAKLGTVQLRAEFANPSLSLLPGQFVRARIEAGEQEGVLVPQAAVLRGDQGQFVWTIDAEGKAATRPVQTAGWAGADWVVSKGLAAGDKVIVDNLMKLRPGAAVQPRPAQPPGGSAAGGQASSGADAPKR